VVVFLKSIILRFLHSGLFRVVPFHRWVSYSWRFDGPYLHIQDLKVHQEYGIEPLMTKTRCSFETSRTTYPVTQRHILEARNHEVIIF
jgi:hypothetical protein